MYAFLDRLIHLALPRIRDFQGISPKVLMVQEITV
jgi:large subunit ribosomal protein L5